MGLRDEKVLEMMSLSKSMEFNLFLIQGLNFVSQIALELDIRPVKMSILLSKHGKKYAQRYLEDREVSELASHVLNGDVNWSKPEENLFTYLQKRKIKKLMRKMTSLIDKEDCSLEKFRDLSSRIKKESFVFIEIRFSILLKKIEKHIGRKIVIDRNQIKIK